ncbi:hypothetical protein CASFOL_033856 [Castilleja foliolosa]|uniref:Uncharacterized protein n=1 Tax=Castilleja foliolosa TaxID=1961234 RepID=A0ABD3BY55_9LAMI
MGRKRRGHWVFENDSESESEYYEEIKESEEEADEECDYELSDKRVMAHGMMMDEVFDAELGEDVTIKLGAPFKVYEDEAKLYESLKTRDVIRPVNIYYRFWELMAENGDRFGKEFLRLIDLLKLGKWASIEECAYPTLMREFYTTVSISGDGTIKCRFGGKWCKFTKLEFMDAFGYYACEGTEEGALPDHRGFYPKQDVLYDEKKFWDSMKCKDVGETDGFPVMALYDNPVFVMYRFLAKSVFGKEKAVAIPKDELYLLWKILKARDQELESRPGTSTSRPINLYPFVLSTIMKTKYLKAKQPPKLSLGAMITVLAKRRGWQPGANDEKVSLTYLRLIQRLLRTPMRPKGKMVQVCCLRRRDEDVDADIKYYLMRAPHMLYYFDDFTPPPEWGIERPRKPQQKPITPSQLKKMREILERDDPSPPKN